MAFLFATKTANSSTLVSCSRAIEEKRANFALCFTETSGFASPLLRKLFVLATASVASSHSNSRIQSASFISLFTSSPTPTYNSFWSMLDPASSTIHVLFKFGAIEPRREFGF